MLQAKESTTPLFLSRKKETVILGKNLGCVSEYFIRMGPENAITWSGDGNIFQPLIQVIRELSGKVVPSWPPTWYIGLRILQSACEHWRTLNFIGEKHFSVLPFCDYLWCWRVFHKFPGYLYLSFNVLFLYVSCSFFYLDLSDPCVFFME